VDSQGNLYIADIGNHVVRKAFFGGGMVTIAGTGVQGFSGDDGLATDAKLSSPCAVAVDANGNVYIADSGNHIIRRIDKITGVIKTIVGTPQVSGYSGDGGLAVSAKLKYPAGLTFDAAGNLFISDTGNDLIRKVTFGN
jgi:DNA-binding beta-propeller fold protein YncE